MLSLVWSQSYVITLKRGVGDILLLKKYCQLRQLHDSLKFLSLKAASIDIQPTLVKTPNGEAAEKQKECRKLSFEFHRIIIVEMFVFKRQIEWYQNETSPTND